MSLGLQIKCMNSTPWNTYILLEGKEMGEVCQEWVSIAVAATVDAHDVSSVTPRLQTFMQKVSEGKSLNKQT